MPAFNKLVTLPVNILFYGLAVYKVFYCSNIYLANCILLADEIYHTVCYYYYISYSMLLFSTDGTYPTTVIPFFQIVGLFI